MSLATPQTFDVVVADYLLGAVDVFTPYFQSRALLGYYFTPGHPHTLTDESRPIGGFIPAESLVQNGTTGGNGTAGGTLHQPVLGFLLG